MSENTDPLVTVIIPVYNGADHIACALDSAISQTYQNIEIIVVDDGSTDATPMILKQYAESDSRIRLIFQANAGVARARNHAIAAARGEFIAPLDADDLWAPAKIERQMEKMLHAGNHTGLIYCWWVWIDLNGRILDRSPLWRIEGDALITLIKINFTGNASVPLFRKRCVEEAGGYDEQLAAAGAGGCEDWELALRIAANAKIAVVPEVLLGYRRRPGSMSAAYETMWRSQQIVMQKMHDLRPSIRLPVYRQSDRQFALYLAGLAFWAGDLGIAFGWAFRSGLRLPIAVARYLLRVWWRLHLGKANSQFMSPGIALVDDHLPAPLVPYEKIYKTS